MPRPKLLDTPAQGTYGEEGYVASKKGLFSALGNILTKTAVGIQDPSALGQLQQREMESQMEFEKYRQNRMDYKKERENLLAQQEFEKQLKLREAGLTPPTPQGVGLTGRAGLVPIGGQFYQRDPIAESKDRLANEKALADLNETQKKSQLMEKFLSGSGGNVPPGTTFSAGGFNIPLNQPLNEAEQGAVLAGKVIPPTLNSIKTLIEDPELKGNMDRFSADSLPYFMISNPKVEELKNLSEILKADIPFKRGGKALTKEESKRVDSLLSFFGRDNETILRNLDTFEKEFLLKSDLTELGSSDIKKLKSGGNKIRTPSGFEFTYEEAK